MLFSSGIFFLQTIFPSWNTDFLASNNFFHTLLNSRRVFHRAGFFHSPGIFPIFGNQWWPRLRLSPSLVPLGGEQYHSSLRLKGTMTHSCMKHGFFSLKQFLSHITKFPRGFSSSKIFPFTWIYLAGFFHSPRFFFPPAGFFISFDLNLWSLFKIRRFLKKWLEDFLLLVKKNYQIFM